MKGFAVGCHQKYAPTLDQIEDDVSTSQGDETLPFLNHPVALFMYQSYQNDEVAGRGLVAFYRCEQLL